MLRKQIEQFTVVSLKFFFDLDYALFHHIFLVVLIIAGLSRLFLTKLIIAFQEGATTVKQDYQNFREVIINYKTRWMKSNACDFLMMHTRQVKENISGFGLRK